MKVNPSNMMISTSNRSTQTIEKKLRFNLNFANIYDQLFMANTSAGESTEIQSLAVSWGGNLEEEGGTTYYPGWFDHISEYFQDNDQMSDSLMGEFGKLEQMLNMFFEYHLSFHNGPTQFQLTRIRNVAINQTDLQSHNQLGYRYDEAQLSSYQYLEEKGYTGTAALRTTGGRVIRFSFDVGFEAKFSLENQFNWSQSSQSGNMEPKIFNLNTPLPQFSAAGFDFILNPGQETDNEPIKGSGILKLATYDPTQHLWITINDHIFNNIPCEEETKAEGAAS